MKREQAARVKLQATEKRALVKAIDLIDLFPLGETPDIDTIPGAGVIIVRSPTPARTKEIHAEVEAKTTALADVLTELVCETTLDPDPRDQLQGAKLRAFFEAWPQCAIAAGNTVLKLGGSRTAVEKRGRV